MQQSSRDNTRVAIYARVSTEEQKDGRTIDSQISELVRHAEAKTWMVVEIYKDEGWSGSLLARPGLDRLRDDAFSRRFAKVLVNDVDRLARDVSHLGIIKRDLEKSDIEIIFRKLPAEKSPTQHLMINILGSFAEFEREMIIDRTRRGRRHHIEVRQKMVGCIPSYGYRYVKSTSSKVESYFEVVPEEAAVIKQMFSWVDEEGLSIKRLAERLNSSSFKPRKSQHWATSTVARMLHNETYAGLWYYNKNYSCEPIKRSLHSRYRPPKTSRRKRPREEWWRPVPLAPEQIIIKREQWDRVQKQIATNASVSPRNSKHFYLLKGLVKCGGCLSGFTGGAGNRTFLYRCLKRCNKVRAIKSDHLEQIIWTTVEQVILDPKIILPKASEIHQKTRSKMQDATDEIRSLKGSAAQLEKEEERVMLAYRTGVLTPTQLGEQLQKLKDRKTALETRRREFGNVSHGDQLQRSTTDFCTDAASRIKSFTLEERQRFLNLIIERVIVNNHEVRIVGIIPSFPKAETEKDIRVGSGPNIDSTTARLSGTNSAEIDSQRSYRSGRNSASIESLTNYHRGTRNQIGCEKFFGRNSHQGYEFQINRVLVAVPTIPQTKVLTRSSSVK